MPSAANLKIEKPLSTENSVNESNPNAVTPLRQAITTIEHKIRNLEKRKAKLESYRELQSSGKDLNQDQKTAIAKYGEVIQTLEFAREQYKQFLSIATASEKEAKKQARKDAVARSQGELAKVREVLLVQDALAQMGQDNIREDFLNGRNGAAQLSENDLKLLDDLYAAVTPKHEPGDSQIFCTQIQAAAEHLLAVVDGKPKEAFGSTYSNIKDIIGRIHESGYFDQSQEPAYVEVIDSTEHVQEAPVSEVLNHENVVTEPTIPPAIEAMTIEPRPPVQPMQPVQQVEQPLVQSMPPEQQMYFQQQQQQQPPQPPQTRPLTEVLGPGSFSFLQDSELDTPPEQIPSQTFTNQSYVQGPPPPIPMPPHFQTYPQNPAPPQSLPQQPQLPQPQQPLQQPPPSSAAPLPGNGVEENHDHQSNDSQKQRGRPRSNNQQSYYTTNNGYNNRQRQNRSGPRAGNRHNQ
ncbi:gpi-anchored protein [Holotrichia oblita]|uniref:Gpi-anchored protein n=1 Tax=Holotrichia oblita TaxID=644536 RepID=A0ACB9T986_HOLOL|nr:gpi-anchored protein [Holotrichia oblita]